MTWLDQAISWLSPKAGLRRARARAAMNVLLAYEGAKTGRRMGGWSTTSSSENAEVSVSLPKLRERSRALVRDNPYAARAISEIVGQAIGTGITAQTRSESLELNKQIDEAWQAWSEECDADEQLDFNGIEELVTREVLEAGEALIRFRVRPLDGTYRVPLQLQVIEPECLDFGKTERTNYGFIIQGVEFDLLYQRIAYWFFPQHPGDVVSTSRLGFASQRIPASEIVHVYRKKRVPQVHGVPLLAPVLLTLRDLDEYQDAERVRKKIEACLAMFVGQEEGADSTLGAITDANGRKIETFEPGMIAYGRVGQEPTFFAPTGVGGYGEYIRQNERMVATGVGVTYEQLTGDLSQVNYSSYRAGHMSFRRSIEALCWVCIIPMLLRPIRRRFIDAAFSALFPAETIPATAYKTEWTPPAFGSVDPLKDAQAVELDLRVGRSTWPQVVAEYGYDPHRQLQEILEWKRELEKAGISFSKPPAATKPQEPPAKEE